MRDEVTSTKTKVRAEVFSKGVFLGRRDGQSRINGQFEWLGA